MIIGLVMMVASSCRTQKECTHPQVVEFESTVEVDTEIVVPSVRFDTVFQVIGPDTIVIIDEKTKIKLKVVKLPGDSIFITPECPPDTVVITQTKIEKTTIPFFEEKNSKNWLILIGLVAICILSLGFLIRSFKS